MANDSMTTINRFVNSQERLGERLTNTEARQLVDNLAAWAAQFDHPEAVKLASSLSDVKRLFIRVSTEIDEALTRLSLMEDANSEQAREHQHVAMGYLHRWQDRRERIGNAGAFSRGVSSARHKLGQP